MSFTLFPPSMVLFSSTILYLKALVSATGDCTEHILFVKSVRFLQLSMVTGHGTEHRPFAKSVRFLQFSMVTGHGTEHRLFAKSVRDRRPRELLAVHAAVFSESDISAGAPVRRPHITGQHLDAGLLGPSL